MTRLYEGMFVLDNQLVREDWKAAKAVITSALEKHGGKVHTARRWDEKRLAYPIAKRHRGTYLLTYFEMGGAGLPTLTRDLELAEPVLRHLILQADVVPEKELELAKAEQAADFVIPAPPPDDTVEEVETSDRDDRRDDRRRGGPRGAAYAKDDDDGDDDSDDDDLGSDDSDEPVATKRAKAPTRTKKEED